MTDGHVDNDDSYEYFIGVNEMYHFWRVLDDDSISSVPIAITSNGIAMTSPYEDLNERHQSTTNVANGI